jgi:hypothetical protein
VRDLDRKIGALGTASPQESAFFRPPPDPRLEPVEIDIGRLDASQRLRMGDVIQERVGREFEARKLQLQRQAQRNERAAVAVAAAEAEAQAIRETERFAREYDATAMEYAQELGRLRLELLDRLPSRQERLFFPPAALQQRTEERQRIEGAINSTRGRRDEELARLQAGYFRIVAELRATARSQAVAMARAGAEEEARALEAQRRGQQAALQRDLENALRALPSPEPEPVREMPEQRQEITREIARENVSATPATRAQQSATAASLQELQQQRRALTGLIEAATRAAARDVARERGIALEFNARQSDAILTAWTARRLRERWGTE